MLLLVCLCALSNVSAEDTDNATLTTQDTIPEDVSDDNIEETQTEPAADTLQSSQEDTLNIDHKSFADIRQQIQNAKSGDTIQISGVYDGDGNHIVIDKSITIEGLPFESDGSISNYTYLDAGKQSRIFNIQASGVVLKNLVLRNGFTSDDGGAVYCDAYTNCRIDNCIIGMCEADFGGATYYCDAYNSIFLRNSADRGGAMYGGNAYYCGFANNTATDRGGAIYVRDGVTIDNCEFENNTAEYGGALYSCADYNTVSNCDFDYNYAGDDGGAIYNNDESGSGLTVLNSYFRYNEADDDGGAIYTASEADTLVKNSFFGRNDAGYWGGAMCRGVARNSTFYQNNADRNGGGMYYGTGYDCIFISNYPQNVYETDCYVTIIGKITLSQSGTDFGLKTVSAKVVNTNNNNQPVSGVAVTFKFSNGKTATVYTGSNGVATYKVPFNPGTYSVTATISATYSASPATMGNIKINRASATLTPKKVTIKYGAGKYFKVKVINSKTKKGISGVKLLLKVYTGKKFKKVHVTTDSSGWAYYGTCKLKAGKHKVKVSVESSQVKAKAKTSKITVKKASTKIWAPDGLYMYKKAGKFYIGVYNKHSGDWIKGMKLKVKVYTKGKAKTYNLKTKKDGFAVLKTKSLKVGKHKVKINVKGNKNFKKSSLTSHIEISKKIPTSVGYHYMYTYYSYGYPSGRSMLVYVKDIYGNELHKKVTLTHSSGAKTTGYSGDYISVPGGIYGKVTIKFKGDKKYMGSKYTINFI